MKISILYISAFLFFSCTNETELALQDAADNIEKQNTSNKTPDGEFIEKHSNGFIKIKGVIKDGKRSGVWTSFFNNGSIQSENKYEKGVLNGKTAVYHSNGQLMYVGFYINGEKDDRWYFYSDNGDPEKEVVFKDGKQVKE